MAEDGDAAAKAEQALGRLHELCEMLRGGLSRAMELKRAAGAKGDASAAGSEKPSAAALAASTALLELKSVNRQVWELVDGFKSRTLAANRAIDEYDLRLNNLQYERNHFLREIKHCRDFGAESERVVDLIDEAEFDRSAPPELRTATPADDPHQYHLNRLELELRQRRSLCESRAARLSERSAREAANQKKKDFVEGLSSQINSLTTMSLPLQRLLGLRVSARYTERKRIALLPPALLGLSTDYYVLQHFYELMDGANWKNNENWLDGEPCYADPACACDGVEKICQPCSEQRAAEEQPRQGFGIDKFRDQILENALGDIIDRRRGGTSAECGRVCALHVDFFITYT